MGRPRTPIGTFGDITYVKMPGGRVRARTRYRDDDGQVRRVSDRLVEQGRSARVEGIAGSTTQPSLDGRNHR